MAKEAAIEVEGIVKEALPNTTFRVDYRTDTLLWLIFQGK